MESWGIARKMTIAQLYDFKGQIIPWPPSDEDVLWWGRIITELHAHKDHLHPGRISNTRPWCPTRWAENTHVYGRFGECAFGVLAGLKPPHLVPWPDTFDYDFIVAIHGKEHTIDVKTRTVRKPQSEVFLNLTIPEIESKQKKGKPFCDIYICAWLPPHKVLSMQSVLFLGWAYRDEILQAPIIPWKSKFGGFADARGIISGDLRPMSSLLDMVRPRTPKQMPLDF